MTSFTLNWKRSLNPALSRDPFARHWIPKDLLHQQKKYFDDLNSPIDKACYACLRHRYILDSLQDFQTQFPEFIFVNLGAGMSSYPYLLGGNISSIEFDQTNIIGFKRKMTKELKEREILPEINIKFEEADLDSLEGIEREFLPILK